MYNATAYTLKDDGSILSTSIVELDDNGLVIRAAGYWTHSIGTEAYDADWRRTRMGREVRIERDGGAGYKNRLSTVA
jgi:hypothetical protein